jgi:ATP-dependent exoDNAse (exonuclease V) alpha subunit
VHESIERAPTARPEFEKARKERAREALESATRHLSERHSVFTDRKLNGETVRAGVIDGVTLKDAHDAVLQGVQNKKSELVATQTPGVLTTKTTIASELEVRAIGHRGSDSVKPVLTRHDATQFIRAYENTQDVTLTRGQREATFQVLTGNDRVTIVEGYAGTGKTRALDAIRQGAEKGGYAVVALAPSAAAAREVQSEAGIESHTIARWLQSEERDYGMHLYVVDEAGMVSTHDMLEVLQRAEGEGNRVVLVGDPRQLSSIEAGAPLRALIEDGVPTVTLGEILRQRDQEIREMVTAYARGDSATGARMAMTYFHESNDVATSAAQDYLARESDVRDATLIVSSTNATRHAINDQVREGLRGEKRLGPDVQVRTLQRIDLTREEAARAHSYQVGNVVVPRTDYHQRGVSAPLLRGEEYRVVEVHDRDVALEQRNGGIKVTWDPKIATKVSCYREETLPIAKGDRVIFRENSRIENLQVVNGDRGTVTRTDQSSITVTRNRDGEVVHVGVDQGARIEHSYATTVHSAQGITVDHVIIAGETGELASAETAYVGLSRESESVTVYTKDPERLREAWSTEKGQENALDHMGLDKARAWEQARNQEGEGPTVEASQRPEKKLERDNKEMEI